MAYPKSKITLRSPGGLLLEVEQDVAMQSEELKALLEKKFYKENIVVEVPDDVVHRDIIIKVLEYTKKIVEFQSRSATFGEIMAYFVPELESKPGVTLLNMLTVGHNLNIKVVSEVVSTIIADNISGLPVEHIRDYLGVVNDFTPEEERRIRESRSSF